MRLVKLAVYLSVALAASAADLQFEIPMLRTTFPVGDQPVAIALSGHVAAHGEAVHINLDADLGDLQAKILPILSAQLKKDDRCGDRMFVQQAKLEPDAPGALLTATVHYEKWGCAKAFGKEIVKRLAFGNALVKARLTPVVDSEAAIHMRAEVMPIEADGQLGEILRSGQAGTAIQEKIRRTLESDFEKAVNPKTVVPQAAQEAVAIESASFRDAGERRLALAVAGEIRMTPDQAATLAGQFHAAPH